MKNVILTNAGEMMQRYPSLRFGQCVFNVATTLVPALNKVTGTADDCFYDDSKVEAFLSHLD